MKLFATIVLQLGFIAFTSPNACHAMVYKDEDETSFIDNVTITPTEPMYHKRNPYRSNESSHLGFSFMNYDDISEQSTSNDLGISYAEESQRGTTTSPTTDKQTAKTETTKKASDKSAAIIDSNSTHDISNDVLDLSSLIRDFSNGNEHYVPLPTNSNLEEIKHYSDTIKTLNINTKDFDISNFVIKPKLTSHVSKSRLYTGSSSDIAEKLKLQELTIVKEGDIFVGRIYDGYNFQFKPKFHEPPTSFNEILNTEL
ncbi:hypothetical protein BmR1_04g06300 [Babesia microti strain RI]|uniref:Uncharacterized protein n=1 Tax=Babesia microti (strain RI) TaxID=1133968 RepID=I7IHA2_BABMR|nr:hypothetical protein BmR1_04g06300 [Babesia microti strain RI]CCF75457.1 hypothetical protein BmR1_04g06300 [Babesia microti strain RI]|eukprot:XP_012649865.1 hypothetical protein BmR1_04g06300 [Babesia microti strain RI]